MNGPVDHGDHPDHHAEASADPRVLALVLEYAAVHAADFERVAADLWRLQVPFDDAHHFDGRREWLLAFSVAALEHEPAADMAVIGSPFVDRLMAAIRDTGRHRHIVSLPPAADHAAAPPAIALVDAVFVHQQRTRTQHRLARMVARVKLDAGAAVLESIVESDIVDITAGTPVPDDVAAVCNAYLTRDSHPPAAGTTGEAADHSPPAGTESYDVADGKTSFGDSAPRSIELFRPGLERQVAPIVGRMRDDAQRALASELQRIDSFYAALLAELDAEHATGSAAMRATERDRERRRDEEQRRHTLRTTVTPIQLVTFDVPAERCSWLLRTPEAVTAPLHAHRLLTGNAHWRVTCPACGAPAVRVAVCHGAHAICDRCAGQCSVCRQRYCANHGFAACHVDGAGMCAEHGATCTVCERTHCITHTAHCVAGHDVCIGCSAACEICGRSVCDEHARRTHEQAPLGTRRLCADCCVHCEGGSSEPVGRDEAVPCATCGRWICSTHQVACDVDGNVHCSTHLRRSDHSRRFLCPAHQTHCARDPGAIVAITEVEPCSTCGAAICPDHGAVCAGCGGRHCMEHLEPLEDVPGHYGCATHREHCHTDGRAWSIGATSPCATCGRSTCSAHRMDCPWCGASVCIPDLDATSNRCFTCTRLVPATDVADELIAATVRLTRGRRARGWAVARDASRHVVQVDFGWTRRFVLSVPQGSAEATAGMAHTLLTHVRLR